MEVCGLTKNLFRSLKSGVTKTGATYFFAASMVLGCSTDLDSYNSSQTDGSIHAIDGSVDGNAGEDADAGPRNIYFPNLITPTIPLPLLIDAGSDKKDTNSGSYTWDTLSSPDAKNDNSSQDTSQADAGSSSPDTIPQDTSSANTNQPGKNILTKCIPKWQQKLFKNNTTYTLTEDLEVIDLYNPDMACFYLENLENVMIDCQNKVLLYNKKLFSSGGGSIAGFQVKNSKNITIKNCHIRGFHRGGIELEGVEGGAILNNIIENTATGISGGNGFYNGPKMIDTKDLVIGNNVIINAAQAGMVFYDQFDHNSIVGNTIVDTKATGIVMYKGANGNTLEGNIVKNSKSWGMEIGAHGTTITGNKLSNNGDGDFWIWAKGGVTLSNNEACDTMNPNISCNFYGTKTAGVTGFGNLFGNVKKADLCADGSPTLGVHYKICP